jgi:hypothetical protein
MAIVTLLVIIPALLSTHHMQTDWQKALPELVSMWL